MKKKNLLLRQLTIKSFVTSDASTELDTVKGGKVVMTVNRNCQDSLNCPVYQTLTQCGTEKLCETMVVDLCMG